MEGTVLDMFSSRSVSNSCCFDFALDFLDWLHTRVKFFWVLDTWLVKIQVRLLKTLDLCTSWKHQTYNGIYFRIKDLLYRKIHDLYSAYLRYQCGAIHLGDIYDELFSLRCDMRRLFETDIKQWCITLLEYNPVRMGLEDDGRLTVDFIESLLQSLMDLQIDISKHFVELELSCVLKDFRDELMFLKNLISFAKLQGVERNPLIDLLIHIEVVVADAACLSSIFWFDMERDLKMGEFLSKIDEMQVEISKLINSKICPVDPQVRETYINVLTASKSSRSFSHTSVLKKNKHLLAAELNDYFLSYIMKLLTPNARVTSLVEDQMLKFFEGLSLISFVLREEEQEKFNDELMDLIGIVVIDVGIVICSLSVNEMIDFLNKKTARADFHLLKVINLIKAEVAQIHTQSLVSFPRTNELGSIDFLVENIKELAITEADSDAFPKGHIHTVVEDLEFLKSFLRNTVEHCNRNKNLQALWNGVMEVAYNVKLLIDSIVVGKKPDCLDIIAGDIKLMRTKAQEIYDSMRHDNKAHSVAKNSIHMASPLSTPELNEHLVNLDDEVNKIIDRLTFGSKRLDIVSVVGMPGLGKTTLASKVYNDPIISYHFHVRAWCCVSQGYSKHSLLVQILCSIFSKSPDQYIKKKEDNLAEELYKCLKGKSYVIVLDDLWHIDAWNLLEKSFPDDANGSRILMTSRSHNVSLQIKLDSEPHRLRPLTSKESWELLQSKIFGKENCPPALSVVGMQIAEGCKGLPLTVVIVAGILASVEHDCWQKIANSLSSCTVIETEHGMKTLDLSYRFLPDYLKPCLLYFGAFKEDQEIPVRRLVLLWISEGFVEKSEVKSLEDVAEEYLMDLIDRNLVMVTKQRSVGGVKTCTVHDLVHEFCVAKAKEERFLQILHHSQKLFPLNRLYNTQRLCLCCDKKTEVNIPRMFFPHLRCLILSGERIFRPTELSSIVRKSKLLRVLDLEKVYFGKFLSDIELHVHLRYLVIPCYGVAIPPSIANLLRLETFIIISSSAKNVTLPDTIWKMKKLRHLCIKFGSFSVPIDNLEVSTDLHQLDTFGALYVDFSSQCLQKILSRIPNIRRLKCSGENCDGMIELKLLSRLESLNVAKFHGCEFAFPLNLRKLTISSCYQQWSRISTIGKLPNLEALKLLNGAFVGETWEMREGEFLKLKFLKFELLNIVRWTTSGDDFPPLQKLVLIRCWKLEEVPACLADIPTIEMIEVSYCHSSAVSLVKQIEEQQMDMGNVGLKILIKESVQNRIHSLEGSQCW